MAVRPFGNKIRVFANKVGAAGALRRLNMGQGAVKIGTSYDYGSGKACLCE
jgi:hypothetical protein